MSKQSATRIVQSLLSQHEHLSTQQIYQMSTENLRPVLRPAHVIDNSGRIRMKRVSNMREGRRPWVPVPTAPFPEHPFQSMNFLKRTVLASLESQGLIHKARIARPIETDEERQEAVKTAMRLTRKDERTALRLNQPVPPPREPKTTVTEFAWKMGPPVERAAPPHIRQEEKANEDEDEDGDEDEFDESIEKSEKADRELAMRMRATWADRLNQNRPTASASASASTSGSGSKPVPGSFDEMAARWDQAVRLEESFHRAREIEDEQIRQRQQARRAAFKLERERKKAERQEDVEAGRAEAVRAEKKRIEALEAIESYARQTGEDVSDWYKELGIHEGESIPLSEKKKERAKRKGGFGLRD